MYELQNQNANKEVEHFKTLFDIFNPSMMDSIDTSLHEQVSVLKDYLSRNSTDLSYSKLLNLFDYLLYITVQDSHKARELANSYCVCIENKICSNLDEELVKKHCSCWKYHP